MNLRSNVSVASFRAGSIAAVLCFAGLQSLEADSAGRQQLASANAGFGFNLLHQLAAEQPGSNIFISPYSASTVLQMVSTGAGGETRTQMQEVLGTVDMKPAALNEANKEIAAIINSQNTNFILTTANALWYLKGFSVEAPFIAGNEQYFGATVGGLNFTEPSAVGAVNAWASSATRGKIDKIVRSFPSTTRLFLANAVYFLGNWQTPFDTNLTTDRAFSFPGGILTPIPMMQQSGYFNYCAGNGYQAVQLPYKGGDLSMYVFLPDSGLTLQELISAMDGTNWQQTINQDFAAEYGTLVLPKFNLNYAVELNQPLKTLGMRDAFLNADFSRISLQPLKISSVQQQAIVEVNELGTVAAAVTGVGIVGTVVPSPSFQMTVNRPFLFFIQEQQAGTLLFMGAVFNP